MNREPSEETDLHPVEGQLTPEPPRDDPEPHEVGYIDEASLAPHEGEAVDTLSQWQLIRLRFLKHKVAVAAMFVLIILYFVAAFAEFVAVYDKSFGDVRFIYSPPQVPSVSLEHGLHAPVLERHQDPVSLKSFYRDTGEVLHLGFFVKGEPYKLFGLIPMERRLFGPVAGQDTPFYFLGSDAYGRDLFSRLVFGARISLSVGLVSIVMTFFLGAVIGGISGYVGGATDNLIQRSMEVIGAFPSLPLWLALAAMVPGDWSPLKAYFAITILLSVLGWTGLARLVRGKILSLREEDYAVAARLLGASDTRILFRHLLPGFSSHIIVSLSLSVPGMILGETGLSFLGLGLRPPVVSWGVLLQDCLNLDVVTNYPWLLMPVVMIILTVLAFNFFGDGMRDAADPYSR